VRLPFNFLLEIFTVIAKASQILKGSLMKKIQQEILTAKKVFVGLEDSLRSWKICVRHDGAIIFQGSMPTDYSSLRQFFLKKFPKCQIKLIYEAGFQGFWLYYLLTADNFECIVTPPHTVTDEKNNKVKTDKRDAKRLAKNLENNDYKACRIPSVERQEDRQVSRVLFQVQKKIVSTKNQIRKVCHYFGVEDLPHGSWTDADYQNLKAREFPESFKISLDSQFTVLETLQQQKKYLREKLKKLAQTIKYKKLTELITSVPGIGWFTGIRLLLEWGDLSDFLTGKHFAGYTGLTGGVYSTGETEHKKNITKQGNTFCRAWLIEAAWAAIRKDPVLAEKFSKVSANSGKKNKAIVAVARKLAVRIRAVLLSGQPYQIGLVY
jgi:transposase